MGFLNHVEKATSKKKNRKVFDNIANKIIGEMARQRDIRTNTSH